MPDEGSMLTMRAVAEAILPPVDGTRGAADLGVHEHLAELIDKVLPGFVDLLAMLLDAYATDIRPGAGFADLDLEGRAVVLRRMATEEGGTQDMRDAVDALFVFTLGGTYSEWTGYDRASGRLEAPAAWRDIGYQGPVAGHPDYRPEYRPEYRKDP